MRIVAGAKALIFAMAAVLASSVLISCGPSAAKVSLVFVSSMKGTIFPVAKQGTGVLQGGISLISSRVSEQRSAGTTRVFASNNTIHGSPEAFFSEGEAVISAMNALGLDALFVDAREFNFGKGRLAELAKIAKFPLVAANIRESDGAVPGYLSEFYWDPELKLALIGLAGPSLLLRNLDSHVQGLHLIDAGQAVAEALSKIRVLKAKTVGVVAVGFKTSAEPGSRLDALAAREGVDFVVQGDLDNSLPDSGIGKIFGISDAASDNAFAVSRLQFQLAPEGPARDLSMISLPVDSISVRPDESMRDLTYRIRIAADEILDERVASMTDPVTENVDQESTQGDFVCDLIRGWARTDLAFLNSGALRDGLPRGSIRVRDIYRNLPFGGNLAILRVSGKTVLSLLRRSLGYVGHPEKGRGFLQVSGLSFSWDPRLPELIRPEWVRVGGASLDLEKSYSLATDIFIVNGGDGYSELESVTPLRVEATSTVNLLIQVMQSRETWTPPALGRIRETS